MNAGAISNGVVAVASVQLSAGASTSAIGLTGAAASSSTGSSLAITATGGTIIVIVPTVLAGVQCSPSSLGFGAAATCTVSLNQAAGTGGAAVAISSNCGTVTVPASVTVPAGSSAAQFQAAVSGMPAGGSATITAAWQSVSKAAALAVIAPVPGNLTATATTSSDVSVAWSAAATCGVSGYNVYRAGVKVGSSATTSYQDTGLTASTAYTYSVAAYDASGTVFPQSASAVATTLSALPVTLTTSGSSVGRYDVYEITMQHVGTYANPWEDIGISAAFKSPSGKTYTVGGFYYDTNIWKLRFAPPELGAWTWSLTFNNGSKQFKSSGSLTSVASANTGFVRLNTANPNRLMTEAGGAPFYPLGFNDCVDDSTGASGAPDGLLDWWMDAIGPVTSDQYFSAYSGGKNNMFRHGPGNCAFYIMDGAKFNYQGSGKNFYFVQQGKLQDELTSKLHRYGMKYLMTMFSDPTYYVPNYDLSNAAVKAAWMRYNQYLINRWGAYVDVWELMNEKSSVPAAYLDAMTAYIDGNDPYQHLVTTSYQPGAPRAGLDTTDVHQYFSAVNTSLDYEWVYGTYGIKSYASKYPNQPLIFGESGNIGPISNYDPERYRMGIWTVMMNGASVLYWNSSYTKYPAGHAGLNNMFIGPEERNFSKILMNAMSDLDPAAQPLSVTASANMRGYVLSSTADMAGYVTHTNSHTTVLTGATLKLTIPRSGMTGQWINPSTGAVVQTFSPNSGAQTLTVPAFTVDLALRIRSTAAVPPPPPPPPAVPPSVPANVAAVAASASQINLSWSVCTGASGVAGYKVYRGGVQVATATSESYSDTGLAAATTYSYTVASYDSAGNTSAQSSAASAKTAAVVVVVPTLTSLTCAAPSVVSGGSVSCTATLSAAASAATAVTLSSSAAALSVPATASVAAGATSAAFTATAGTVSAAQTITLTATLNGVAKTVQESVTAPVTSAKFLIKGVSTELIGLTNGSPVFATAAPQGLTGTLVVKGTGSASFGPVGSGSGVSFGKGGQQSNNTAFYSFTGAPVKDLFSPTQNQVTFKLTSRYSFAERLLLPAYNYRWVYDVYDNTQRLYYFRVLAANNQMTLEYATGGSASQYYVIPAGQQDSLFGKGVTLSVKLAWNGASSTLYLNGNLVRTMTYTPLTANWTGSPSFAVGATDVHVYGGGTYSCDDWITDFQVGP